MGSHITASSGGAPNCIADSHGHCSICRDEAIAGVVLSVNGSERTAEIRLGDRIDIVALDLIDLPLTGEVLLIHQGFAISRVVNRT